MGIQGQRLKRDKNQSGLVSIIVTMFLMIVITLIVLGFARLTRRDQRQVLDRQLSTQAFYAAESGVNDAIKVLHDSPPGSVSKSSCLPDSNFPAANAILDSTTSYTCLLIDPTPTSLPYTVGTDASTVVPLNTSQPIKTIILSWEVTPAPATTSVGACPALNKLPAVSGYPSTNCDAGVLRVDLVPVGGSFTRTSLNSSTFTALFQPVSGGSGTINYPQQGAIVPANCTGGSTPVCTASIGNLGGMNYVMRVRSMYKSNSLTISAVNAGGGALQLTGAQAVIDSTGKANDVLRRVVVHVKLPTNTDGVPDYAIQSKDTICKRFYAYSGTATFDPVGVPAVSGASVGPSNVCDPNQQ